MCHQQSEDRRGAAAIVNLRQGAPHSAHWSPQRLPGADQEDDQEQAKELSVGRRSDWGSDMLVPGAGQGEESGGRVADGGETCSCRCRTDDTCRHAH